MLEKRIRILNLDNSVTAQRALAAGYETEIIDLTDLGPKVRFWMGGGIREELLRRIPERGGGRVTFLGSGDFHHVSELLLSRFEEPVSLVDFDFHQDWDSTSSLLHCGSWVSRAMERQNIRKCVILGASSKDFSFFSLQAGDLALLKDDRLEIYPYSSKPGAVFFKSVPDNISIVKKEYPFLTRIFWNELKGKNIKEFFLGVIDRLPTDKVYITIDKDCLADEAALTNWDQGEMPLDCLLEILKMIKCNREIVGMDITGDYSPVRTDGMLKNAILRLNHPHNIKAAGLSAPSIAAANELTNLKILGSVIS